MEFPRDFWELIWLTALSFAGSIIYSVATQNRGSFADTPDWSKVIRRITEVACIFVSLFIIPINGWGNGWLSRILFVVFPLAGLFSVFLMRIIVRLLGKGRSKHFKDNLAEHLVNSIILAFFFLSTLLILLLTLAKYYDQILMASSLLIVLDLLLSIEFAFLLYQLYYLIVVNNVPSEEIVQIVRICNDLSK